jgi:hypothetical protein
MSEEYTIQLAAGESPPSQALAGLFIVHYNRELNVPVLSRSRDEAKRFTSPEAAWEYWRAMPLTSEFTIRIEPRVTSAERRAWREAMERRHESEAGRADPPAMGLDR